MGQEVLFDVFCDKYTTAYVGQAYSKEKIDALTIEQVQESLNFFKMEYHDKIGKLITTTPDTVFNKMLDYIPILPNDAVKWTFCLPSIYYNSLSAKLRKQMAVTKYILPQPSLLTTKEEQLHSMSICRAWAVEAQSQLKLVEESVQSLITKEITGLRASGNLLQPTQQPQQHQQQQVSFYQQPPPAVGINTYNNMSRAEDTIRREETKKKRAMDCPSGFVQGFVTTNGLQYPCHPADGSKHSQFSLDFRGCFGCGSEQHSFAECPTKRDTKCYINFHWNLHCHKPDIFFRNRDKRSSPFKAQRQTSSLSHYG